MRHSTRLRPATREDALYLSTRLREEDKAELLASSGSQPLEALLLGLDVSVPHAWVMDSPATGKPFLMGGIRPVSNIGIVWMLATPAIGQYAAAMHREAKSMLQRIRMSQQYTAIANAVSAENTTAIRWLEKLGFIFVHKNMPVGIDGALFHSFSMSMQHGGT